MNRIKRFRIVALASAAALATLASSAARADIFAATCVDGGQASQDITILNASTGVPLAVPAGVNTSGFEYNPTISSDGRRLVFARQSGPSQRLIAADLSTGQSADLFTGLEISELPIYGSAITPGGTTVATGRPFRSVLSFFFPRVTLTSLATFPGGPFSRTTLSPTRNVGYDGHVVAVAPGGGGNLFAMQLKRRIASSPLFLLHDLVLVQSDGSSSPYLRSSFSDFSQPAMAATNPASVLFVQRNLRTEGFRSFLLPGDIMFRPATLAGFSGTPTRLGLGVSTTTQSETQPALTADGRYVAFVREAEGAADRDRLFVWDSQTQILLNPNGVDLGPAFTASQCRSLSLYTRSIIGSSTISQLGNVNVTLTLASSIGIFVQRIVGKTEVLGRKAYELEPVGRFPLGSYGAGNVFTHWDFEVGGEPLAPGKYLVTVRAVEGDVVRELGNPQLLKVHKNGRIRVRGTEEDL